MNKLEIRLADTGETKVHYDGAFGDDYSLCGIALDVDPWACAEEPKATNKKVNCEKCLQIVRYVRGKKNV